MTWNVQCIAPRLRYQGRVLVFIHSLILDLAGADAVLGAQAIVCWINRRGRADGGLRQGRLHFALLQTARLRLFDTIV